MKTFRRIAALLLALVLLTVSVSCSEGGSDKQDAETEQNQNAVPGQENAEGEEATEEDSDSLFTKLCDDLPADTDLGGRTVTFLQRDTERTRNELFVDELNGDIVNDAVYQREIAVEDRLNTELHAEKLSSDEHGGDLRTRVGNSVQANDKAYDVLANSNFTTANFMPNGYYLNLLEMENLNLSKEYWAQYLIENSVVGGALFGVTGSISLYMYQELFAVYFNRNLCESYGLSAADIYGTVLDGGWTLDKMISMTKDIYSDANGNGQKDAADVYGFGLQVSSSTDGYWSSCQIKMTERNDDGSITLAVDLDKLTSVVERLMDFSYNQPGVFRLIEGPGYTDGEYLPMGFAEDHFLFMNDWVYAAGTAELREMESDYGIIPYPKYDEAQDKYYSYLHDQFTTFCVLVTVEDPADIGAVLEAMCSESHNSVIPAYYDVALTSKYARDTDSVLSLETIFSNPYLDTGWVYSDNLASLPQMILREPVWRGTGSPATTVKQREKMVNKVMGMLVEKFAKAAGKG